jgi:hypothetical protein
MVDHQIVIQHAFRDHQSGYSCSPLVLVSIQRIKKCGRTGIAKRPVPFINTDQYSFITRSFQHRVQQGEFLGLTLQIKHWMISARVIIQMPAVMLGTGFEYRQGEPYGTKRSARATPIISKDANIRDTHAQADSAAPQTQHRASSAVLATHYIAPPDPPARC